MLGVAVGALLGLVFAPAPGDETRAKLTRRMRNLRDLAEEKVDDVRALVAGEDDAAGDEADVDEVEPRQEVRQRLEHARRRRRAGRTARRGGEGDEPGA
jgi:gas vesicle protein